MDKIDSYPLHNEANSSLFILVGVVIQFDALREFVSKEKWMLYLSYYFKNIHYHKSQEQLNAFFHYFVSNVRRCEIICESSDIVFNFLGDLFFICFLALYKLLVKYLRQKEIIETVDFDIKFGDLRLSSRFSWIHENRWGNLSIDDLWVWVIFILQSDSYHEVKFVTLFWEKKQIKKMKTK